MVTALDARTSPDVCAVAGGRGGISDINTGDTTYQPDTVTSTLLYTPAASTIVEQPR